MSAVDLAERQRQADRLVDAEGASYLLHDSAEDTSRPWRLDPLPLVLDGQEWAVLERGVVQRLGLLDQLIGDIYGPQRLLLSGTIPARAVFASPAFQFAARNVRPIASRWLTVYAVDLVRLADGSWRVLRDVTDAPSGAGYALVNRNVSARLMPDAVREMAPVALGGFLAGLRSALDAVAPPERSSPRSVVLSPGLGDRSYFEHSYLAAHLGYHLAEPGDLVVRHGRVWLRAISGLEPVDVLLRRLAGEVADPLESSRRAMGVPGLARAARAGGVGLANPLGSGVAGSMPLFPYVAAAARAMGHSPLLAELRTLWCGSVDDRREVLAAPERFVLHDVGGATRGRVVPRSTAFGSHLDGEQRVTWTTLIEREPHRVVAQERAVFATTPVSTPSGVVEASIVLRLLAVAGPAGITVMPGGLARVVNPEVPIVDQRSGVTKDVWVLDRRASSPTSVSVRALRSMPQVDLRESLPTRVAESMYWIGRSAERSEALARATSIALAELQADPGLLTAADGAWCSPVANTLRALTGARDGGADGDRGRGAPQDEMAQALESVLAGGDGLAGTLRSLSRAASSARQFVSATTWQVLGELETARDLLATNVGGDDPAVRRGLDTIILHLGALSGLFNESTVRGPAWRFLEIGRRVGRALSLLSVLEIVVAPAPAHVRAALFDYVLAANESLVAYRRRYRSDPVLDALMDLLVLDDQNPRALAYQLDQLRSQVALLPQKDGTARLGAIIERISAALVGVAWLPADADQRDPTGRRVAVVRFVEVARAPLLEFADQLNHVYFYDPTRMRQRVGGVR